MSEFLPIPVQSCVDFAIDYMDWHLPLAESTALKGIHQSLNNVDEVVMVCWNAVEAHASAGELKAAILLLSRLLASPYGTANANHELRARCRFAELCYICDILLETAVLHLNRAVRKKKDLNGLSPTP